MEELGAQIGEWNPDVVVLDEALGADAKMRAREAKETLHVIEVGTSDVGDSIREAIVGLPQPGGPVRS